MLTTGGLLPSFTVRRTDGSTFSYRDVWQRRNLLLVSAPEGDAAWSAALAQLAAKAPDLAGADTAVVLTGEAVPGAPFPGVLVADRWGEVYYVQHAADPAALPDPADLADWLAHVRHACPECEGEAR